MALYARLWCDILGDPKLMGAAKNGARCLYFLPWLIAFAKRADDGGRLSVDTSPALPRLIADYIPNANSRGIARCLAELHAIGVLEQDPDGCYRFASWDFRNSGRASDSKERIAERVRRHRARKEAARNALLGAPVTPGNALLKRDVTTQRVESRESSTSTPRVRARGNAGNALQGKVPLVAPGSGEQRISAQLPTDAGRNALSAVLHLAGSDVSRAGVCGLLDLMLAGERGEPRPTGAQLDRALCDYVTNGLSNGQFNANHFRACVRRAIAPEEALAAAPGKAPREEPDALDRWAADVRARESAK